MKIAILGATGNVGSRTLKEAIAAGHTLVAYARRPDAVGRLIVTITGPVRDKTFAQRTLPGIIKAAQDAGTGRLVLVSAFGAGDTASKASGFARLIYRTALKGFLDDKAAAEKLLPASGLAWTIVYPVNLKDAPALDSAAVKLLSNVRRVPGLPTLPFANAAKALVEVTVNAEYTCQRVLVTTPAGWKPA